MVSFLVVSYLIILSLMASFRSSCCSIAYYQMAFLMVLKQSDL